MFEIWEVKSKANGKTANLGVGLTAKSLAVIMRQTSFNIQQTSVIELLIESEKGEYIIAINNNLLMLIHSAKFML